MLKVWGKQLQAVSQLATTSCPADQSRMLQIVGRLLKL